MHTCMHTHTQPFKKGEALISIPYELALDVTPSAPGGMTSKLVGWAGLGAAGFFECREIERARERDAYIACLVWCVRVLTTRLTD